MGMDNERKEVAPFFETSPSREKTQTWNII